MEETKKVRETRQKRSSQGGGMASGMQTRVIEIPADQVLPFGAVEVPAETPVTDWEDM